MCISKKENMLRVIRRQNPRWVPDGMEAIITLPCPLDERPEQAGLDVFGVLWDYKPEAEGGTYPAVGGHTIKDFSKWREQLTVPDLDKVDWVRLKALADSIDRDEYLVQGFVHMGLFERSYLLMGMEEALICYLTETEEMREMLHVIADFKIEQIERYVDACHPDIMAYGDDWGTQNNLFMPADIWRKTIGAETKRIYDCMKRLGLIVNHHSCGKIDLVFEDLVNMGADMFNPCQPCNDLANLKRKFGDKICFVGGIDSQHVLDRPGVTSEEVKQEVRRRIEEMSAGGGYVAQPSHSVPYNPVVLQAMKEAIAEYGRYDQ